MGAGVPPTARPPVQWPCPAMPTQSRGHGTPSNPPPLRTRARTRAAGVNRRKLASWLPVSHTCPGPPPGPAALRRETAMHLPVVLLAVAAPATDLSFQTGRLDPWQGEGFTLTTAADSG